MSTARSIIAVEGLPAHRHGPRLVTQDVRLSPGTPDLAPFIAVSLYDMRGPTFPPHPHAGFMVATYIVPESEVGFVNQDSLGTRNRIPPGALHVTVAGSGVLHEEQPETAGRLARGFQIWIDLPDELREMPPQALHLAPMEVPRIALPAGDVRVLLGETDGARSPLPLPTQVTLLDVALGAGASWTFHLPTQDHAFAFVTSGSVEANGHGAGPGSVVRTRPDGDALVFTGGKDGARFTLFSGPPLAQPRVMGGPFVARDAAQLHRFERDYASGRFGRLVPMHPG